MKNKILSLLIVVLIAGAMLNACKTSNEKKDNAQKMKDVIDTVDVAQQNIQDSIEATIIKFKEESEAKIIENEKSIETLKAKIAKGNKETRAMYEAALLELEEKNNKLKEKLLDFKDKEVSKWEEFTAEFNNDMNELGKALKGFTINNK